MKPVRFENYKCSRDDETEEEATKTKYKPVRLDNYTYSTDEEALVEHSEHVFFIPGTYF